MLKLFFFSILFFIFVDVFAVSKIYLIRHAKVKIDNPGWSSSRTAYNYRKQYNKNLVWEFDAENVLNRIDHHETIDTVFCSPQSRALQTAVLLFNTQIKLRINENLMELNYPDIRFPFIKLPVRIWHTFSLISWVAGINKHDLSTYKYRKQNIEDYSREIINYSEKHGKAIVVAHGIINSELIRILKKKGWKFEEKDGFGNLSVNCMIK